MIILTCAPVVSIYEDVEMLGGSIGTTHSPKIDPWLHDPHTSSGMSSPTPPIYFSATEKKFHSIFYPTPNTDLVLYYPELEMCVKHIESKLIEGYQIISYWSWGKHIHWSINICLSRIGIWTEFIEPDRDLKPGISRDNLGLEFNGARSAGQLSV